MRSRPKIGWLLISLHMSIPVRNWIDAEIESVFRRSLEDGFELASSSTNSALLKSKAVVDSLTVANRNKLVELRTEVEDIEKRPMQLEALWFQVDEIEGDFKARFPLKTSARQQTSPITSNTIDEIKLIARKSRIAWHAIRAAKAIEEDDDSVYVENAIESLYVKYVSSKTMQQTSGNAE